MDLEYELIRKSNRNMYLRVKPDGRIVVTAPRLMPVKRIDEFVRQNEPFILKQLEKNRKKSTLLTGDIDYETGDRILYLGRKIPLVVQEGRPERVLFFNADRILMTVRENATKEIRSRVFQREWKKETLRLLTESVVRHYPMFRPYGISYPDVTIRKMTSRWGSCRPDKGKITLNARLLEVPQEAIDYVVVHEFSHFLHADHSPAFWQTVAHFLPDYKVRRRMLKEV